LAGVSFSTAASMYLRTSVMTIAAASPGVWADREDTPAHDRSRSASRC
jgi:hypothetical protein